MGEVGTPFIEEDPSTHPLRSWEPWRLLCRECWVGERNPQESSLVVDRERSLAGPGGAGSPLSGWAAPVGPWCSLGHVSNARTFPPTPQRGCCAPSHAGSAGLHPCEAAPVGHWFCWALAPGVGDPAIAVGNSLVGCVGTTASAVHDAQCE